MPEPRGYRFHDSRPRIIVGVAASLVVLVILALLVGEAMDRYLTSQRPPETIRGPLPPQPRLGPNPGLEAERFLRQKRTRLESYGWVDQSRGLVHIPIEQAMKILARQHAGGAP